MRPSRRDFIRMCSVPLAAASVMRPRAAGAAAPKSKRGGNAVKGPIFNQDDSEFCHVRRPDEVSGEAVDAWVDGLAAAGVGTLVSCVCAMVTNYASRVWESRWSRYDPAGPDDQPVLRHLPSEQIPRTRRWIESEKRLADLGINLHARAFARCRTHGMGAWASIRMNDLHDCTLEDSPLLSTFYKGQRARCLVRVPYRSGSWPDRALDWGLAEVREHYRKLVVELLESLDLDGLELDWMRFGYHFRPGRELEGGRLLTAWVREVRGLCQRAAKRLGHPVRLGVRVPSRPETARRLGLDGVAWAREGLIDLLVPTPFWATCEFQMPIATWRRLLDGTRTVLAGGLEVRYQPVPGGPAQMVTPELAAGAAVAVLKGGADAVYLFNYFATGHGLGTQWGPDRYKAIVRAMGSLDALDKLPRRHALTHRDVRAPGEPSDDPLPASGTACAFRLQTGPKPEGRTVEVLLGLDPASAAPPEVRVNGVVCPGPPRPRDGALAYRVPAEALADEAHVIETSSPKPVRIVRVEFAVGA